MPSTKQLHHWLAIGMTTGIVFVILAALVASQSPFVTGFDHFISESIQANRTALKTHFFLVITSLGNPLPHIGFILLLVTWLVYRKYYRYLSFATLSILLGTLGNQGIKLLLTRSRPLHKLISIGGYSFPSGHSTASAVFFGTLIVISFFLIKNQTKRWLFDSIATLLALLIGISRIYLNVHYPTDVLGGFLLGITIVSLSAYLILPTRKEP